MSLMAIYRSSGVDRVKYDAIINEIGAGRAPEPGAILHLAGFESADRICVVDVWETREQLEQFRERLAPVLKKYGIPEQAPEVIELHSLMATDEVDRFKPALSPA